MQEAGFRLMQGEIFYEFYNHTALKAKVDYFIPVVEGEDDIFYVKIDEFKIAALGYSLNDIKAHVASQLGNHFNYYDVEDISLTRGEKEHQKRLHELFERVEVK